MFDIISQIMIVILGFFTAYLITKKDRLQKWAYMIGLYGQIFWFYTVLHNEQYILLLAVIFYTTQWLKGINNYFIKGE